MLFVAVLISLAPLLTARQAFAEKFLVFSGDGQRLAATGEESTGDSKYEVLRIWDIDSGKEVRKLASPFNEMLSAVFSPDGKQIAISRILRSKPGATDWHPSVELIDFVNGKLVHKFGTFPNHVVDEHRVDVLAVSPDGKLMAGGNNFDYTIHLWDFSSGAPLRKVGENDFTQMLAAVTAGKPLKEIGRRHDKYEAVAFDSQGTRLSLLSRESFDGNVTVLNLADGKRVRAIKGQDTFALSPCGKLFATANGSAIDLYDTTTGTKSGTVNLKADRVFRRADSTILIGQRIAISHDLCKLAVCEDSGVITLYDLATKEILRSLEGVSKSASHSISDLEFSPDDKKIACISPGNNATKIFDTATGSLLKTFNGGKPAKINDFAYSTDGKFLVAGNSEGELFLLDTNGAVTRTLSTQPNEIKQIAISPDGKAVATMTDTVVTIWDSESGRQICTLETLPDEALVPKGVNKEEYLRSLMTMAFMVPGFWRSLAFSPDGSKVATGDMRGVIAIWDVRKGAKLSELNNSSAKTDCIIRSLEFSPDGKILAEGHGDLFFGGDYATKLWDVDSGKEIRSLEGKAFGLTFAPDGKTLITGNAKQKVMCWDVATGKCLKEISTGSNIITLSVSKDGKILATSQSDPMIKLWDLKDGTLLSTIALKYPMRRISFAPDGKVLAGSTEEESKVTFWDTASGKALN